MTGSVLKKSDKMDEFEQVNSLKLGKNEIYVLKKIAIEGTKTPYSLSKLSDRNSKKQYPEMHKSIKNLESENFVVKLSSKTKKSKKRKRDKKYYYTLTPKGVYKVIYDKKNNDDESCLPNKRFWQLFFDFFSDPEPKIKQQLIESEKIDKIFTYYNEKVLQLSQIYIITEEMKSFPHVIREFYINERGWYDSFISILKIIDQKNGISSNEIIKRLQLTKSKKIYYKSEVLEELTISGLLVLDNKKYRMTLGGLLLLCTHFYKQFNAQTKNELILNEKNNIIDLTQIDYFIDEYSKFLPNIFDKWNELRKFVKDERILIYCLVKPYIESEENFRDYLHDNSSLSPIISQQNMEFTFQRKLWEQHEVAKDILYKWGCSNGVKDKIFDLFGGPSQTLIDLVQSEDTNLSQKARKDHEKKLRIQGRGVLKQCIEPIRKFVELNHFLVIVGNGVNMRKMQYPHLDEFHLKNFEKISLNNLQSHISFQFYIILKMIIGKYRWTEWINHKQNSGLKRWYYDWKNVLTRFEEGFLDSIEEM